jgi:hypothetical protein
MSKTLLDYLPKSKALIDALKSVKKPSIEDRVEALELVMLEQILEGLEDV